MARILHHSRRAFVKYIILTLLALLYLVPLYALTLAAFRPGRDLLRYGITLKTLIPTDLHISTFKGLYTIRDGIYITWFGNSLLLMLLQTSLALFLSSFVAYGLSLYHFKGRKVVTTLVIFLMLVPIQILILPLYKLMITVKLIDTFWGVFLPMIVSPFAIFFFKQYIDGVPRDLIDAGRVDGLNEYAIFFRIVVPIMPPAFSAMAIFMSMQSWNNFLWPLIVLRTGEKFTLPIGLNTLLTPYGNNYDLLIIGALAATLPIIIVFIFFQRYFIAGLTSGGVKG
ncbi:carbohydrate ABC transporter permease [Sphaerochaeta halotolerans]|jgi:arabinosaccharide transport system permease protein|uniref:Carbohydrate ABC transporter permease n=1 Tax=Sphaerochaeta halotolerans TaxID=2293840 RepID=A0A372MFP0_9SPIR|nr:carbohydrate ABC transporter permease [Sphaerochaeta halotolerans]RFU94554.1 carbohydrate ABC transporter permease [Sphaerochaeta halotolerans]